MCKGSFLTGAQDSHLQRVAIPEAAYVQLRRRPPEVAEWEIPTQPWQRPVTTRVYKPEA